LKFKLFKKKYGLIVLFANLFVGCGYQTYTAKPIEAQKSFERLNHRSTDDSGFQTYLLAQNIAKENLPIKTWGLDELTLSAFYFHPDLDVARAQLRASVAQINKASEYPEPGVNLSLASNSDHQNISPWTYTLGFDTPIMRAGKRKASIDEAKSLSEASRIEIAQTAWKVRSRLVKSLLEYDYNQSQLMILERQLALRTEIVNLLEKRQINGLSAKIELNEARIQHIKTEQQLNLIKGETLKLKAQVADNAGLGLEQFDQLRLKPIDFNELPSVDMDSLQYAALVNRLDIRVALLKYDAREAKLRLEIAKQYPDLTLSPSHAIDQGNKIWTLGLSSILNLLNKNKGMIAEANALRDIEFAQFESLQSSVIAQLNQSKASYVAALKGLDRAQNLNKKQLERTSQTKKQYDAGLADLLQLKTAQLENALTDENLLFSRYKIWSGYFGLEDLLQRPMNPQGIFSFSDKLIVKDTNE
jgi:outer membrane protein, heavy metal efflux system